MSLLSFCLALTVDWAALPPWLTLALSGGAAVLALICLLIVVRTVMRVRAEARTVSATVERLTSHMDSFESTIAARIQQATAPIEERVTQGEREAAGLKAELGSLSGTIAEVQKALDRAVQRFEHFEEYFRSVFEKELRFAFRAFDETMSAVLKEMKGELMRGIARIDQIQSVVNSRTRAEAQLTSSEEQAARLLKAGAEPASKPDEAPEPPIEKPGDKSTPETEKEV